MHKIPMGYLKVIELIDERKCKFTQKVIHEN